MRVAIAGSRRLPPGHAPRLLITFLVSLPEDTEIVLRRGIYTGAGRFESEAFHLCRAIKLTVRWAVPSVFDHGREATFLRDVYMIEHVDLLLAFLLPNEAMAQDSGTSHLIEKALDQQVPVYTYTLDRDGTVARFGENDPENVWGGRVPRP